MFIITCTNDTDSDMRYFAFGSGYPYWSTFLSSAQFFQTRERAEESYNSSDFDADNVIKISDGSTIPSPMIHSGAGLNHNKLVGVCDIAIREVILSHPLVQKRIPAAIKRK